LSIVNGRLGEDHGTGKFTCYTSQGASVIDYLLLNKRLYVVFVDLMKCYDTINRNVLWLKLFKLGLTGIFCVLSKIFIERLKHA